MSKLGSGRPLRSLGALVLTIAVIICGMGSILGMQTFSVQPEEGSSSAFSSYFDVPDNLPQLEGMGEGFWEEFVEDEVEYDPLSSQVGSQPDWAPPTESSGSTSEGGGLTSSLVSVSSSTTPGVSSSVAVSSGTTSSKVSPSSLPVSSSQAVASSKPVSSSKPSSSSQNSSVPSSQPSSSTSSSAVSSQEPAFSAVTSSKPPASSVAASSQSVSSAPKYDLSKKITFTTKGYGHGVGMSQWGAHFYAKYDDWTYDKILTHYFPGATLKKVEDVDTTITATVNYNTGGSSGKKEWDIKELLTCVVSLEMNSSMEYEAIKAQVVAYHTYLLYAGQTEFSGRKETYSIVKKAVDEVWNELLLYKGKPIGAFFHASSAGMTNNPQDVWGGTLPCVKSVESKYDHLATGYNGTRTLTREAFAKKLIARYGSANVKDYTTIDPEKWITNITYADSGYVKSITVLGVTIKGNAFRTIMGLRSHHFYIDGLGQIPGQKTTSEES